MAVTYQGILSFFPNMKYYPLGKCFAGWIVNGNSDISNALVFLPNQTEVENQHDDILPSLQFFLSLCIDNRLAD